MLLLLFKKATAANKVHMTQQHHDGGGGGSVAAKAFTHDPPARPTTSSSSSRDKLLLCQCFIIFTMMKNLYVPKAVCMDCVMRWWWLWGTKRPTGDVNDLCGQITNERCIPDDISTRFTIGIFSGRERVGGRGSTHPGTWSEWSWDRLESTIWQLFVIYSHCSSHKYTPTTYSIKIRLNIRIHISKSYMRPLYLYVQIYFQTSLLMPAPIYFSFISPLFMVWHL